MDKLNSIRKLPFRSRRPVNMSLPDSRSTCRLKSSTNTNCFGLSLVGGSGDLFNIYSAWGIAWVMALFEGTVAFVMIGAAMKSMDPSLEESSRMCGAGKWRTMLRITLPLVIPGVLGAAIFVFAEMLGSFAAALVLVAHARWHDAASRSEEASATWPAGLG